MAKVNLWLVSLLFLCMCSLPSLVQCKKVQIIQLDENNWQDMLQGEWMVEFFAPWCPACKQMEKVWQEYSGWAQDLNINVAQVDVTVSPGLSGRFMVTALPTIFHPLYLTFMSIISFFFKLSQILRKMHNKMMEDYGIPAWGSYTIFAMVTIMIGALLGLLLVFIIDQIYPPSAVVKKSSVTKKKKGKDLGAKDSDVETDESDLRDDTGDLIDDRPQISQVQTSNKLNPKKKSRKAD
ncbi:thioredoxin-related transmembrane protein 1-like [Diaphorina citri]|uniref:Thioredoxin-related transmembrane protein 1-like n=1 Tax=Diaphorina citri TaxID=121845 RepID=A0A1S3DBI0_DIACI|nr:thioredoxin-related transmembrane protein 1-like [Diaphorina citri]